MKCVCETRCYVPDGSGVTRIFHRGEVEDYDICPIYFRPLEGEHSQAVDFDTAGEDELMAADYDLGALRLYILSKYGVKAGNRGKDKLVELLLDCRYREVDTGGLL